MNFIFIGDSQMTMKDKLCQLIQAGDYQAADRCLSELPLEEYDEEIAVYDGTIGLANQDGERVWNACANGLSINPLKDELYVLLGEYYFLQGNIDQMYLCYENALYYCKDSEDQQTIRDTMEMIKQNYTLQTRKVSFVILSYNLLDYTKNCIESIRATVPEEVREIIVVDNASKDGSVEWLREQEDILLLENQENVGFPKGCNQGMAAADPNNDIFLLNNDTLLLSNSLFWLRMALYEQNQVGAVGSVSNHCGNLQRVETKRELSFEEWMQYGLLNNTPLEQPYQEKLYLIGFALLIRRETVDRVGDLDERFTPGNFEDNDYGLRILEAGYQNILCRNSFIFHYGSKSFKRELWQYNTLLEQNAQKFKEKWGVDVSYYFFPRRELADWIDRDPNEHLTILDAGCGSGALLSYLKGRYPNASLYGIELVEQAAGFAGKMANVICGNLETMELPWEEEFFDYVILGDVLEHLHCPKALLVKLKKLIKPGGYIIVSIPNVKHYSVFLPLLLKDEFTYTDAGILDRTHLKMYTGKEINRLITGAGYVVEEVRYTLSEDPGEEEQKIIDQLLHMAGTKDPTAYLAYQYLVKAKR